MTIKPPRDISPGGPQVTGQPWDAADKEPVIEGWASVEGGSGPADPVTGEATGRFEDGPVWRQTLWQTNPGSWVTCPAAIVMAGWSWCLFTGCRVVTRSCSRTT